MDLDLSCSSSILIYSYWYIKNELSPRNNCRDDTYFPSLVKIFTRGLTYWRDEIYEKVIWPLR